jgi:spermidine synthase
MRFYAIMELGIGIFALCFPLLTQLTDFIFVSIVNTESPMEFSLSVRAVLAFVLLLAPTSFMGATLPLLTDFFRRSPRHSFSWKVGVLYATNTLGAALGTIAVSFLLIESLGVLMTTQLAAFLNLTVALLGYWISRSTKLIPLYVEPVEKRRLVGMGKVAVGVLAVSGAAALASEVLWTRTLETLVGNSTYAFAMILFLYLLGIAAGSWIMSFAVKRLTALPLWLAGLQMLMGAWTLTAILLFDVIIDVFAQYGDVIVPLSTIFNHYIKAMSVLIPLAVLSGACFPVATRILDPRSEDAKGTLIAKAYAWNTIGALVGSLAAGFVIAPFFDYFQSLYVLAAVYGLTAVVTFAIIGLSEYQVTIKRPAAVSLGVLYILLLVYSTSQINGESRFVKRINNFYNYFNLLYHKPGLQGVTSVLQSRVDPLFMNLLVNGRGMTSKTPATKMMAHLPMLYHPKPEDTLVICFGMGTTYRSAITYGGNVTVVELVKEVLDAFDHFFDDAPRVRAYPNGRIVVNDGRNFLKLTNEKYDVITIDPPPPIDGAGVNNLYSKDLIKLARSRLKKNGIMAHWIPYPGTRAGVDDDKIFQMLVNSFATVFPYSYLFESFEGFGVHIIGSMEPINLSFDRLYERWSTKTVLQDIEEWGAIPFDYLQGIRTLKPIANIPVVTDDRPLLEFYLLRTLQHGGKKPHARTFW